MYYRNSIDVFSSEGVFVDEGSLWKKENDLFVLVDDDQYVTLPGNNIHFYREDVNK
ncbi:hypothetical protein JJL45_05110 [Tamlana sp. s12]|uniref:hypothetical protein n=1 Tax=Tamlana sp. s12 TaxID=1630406 RepID=UPI00192C8F16|nr:hypothetical protein [Tamlana sp. s12]QQY83370.1 hypothetical protein JJL45_05110 [Tamlana sp. s12]